MNSDLLTGIAAEDVQRGGEEDNVAPNLIRGNLLRRQWRAGGAGGGGSDGDGGGGGGDGGVAVSSIRRGSSECEAFNFLALKHPSASFLPYRLIKKAGGVTASGVQTSFPFSF